MEIYKGTPFKGPIVGNELTENHERLREIKDSNYLVRSYELSFDPKLRKILIKDYLSNIKRWEKIEAYGINLPKFSPVIGLGKEGNPYLYFVTERISGPNIEELTVDKNDSGAKEALEGFMEGVIEYSKDVFEQRGEYLSDQDLSQYVYAKDNQGNPKIFFVDLGNEYHVLPKYRGHHDFNSYFLQAT